MVGETHPQVEDEDNDENEYDLVPSPLQKPSPITVAPQIRLDDAPPSATKIWPVI